MKKKYKILNILFGFIFLFGLVFATVSVASLRKSIKLPWQGTSNLNYDSAHNVGDSNVADARFIDNSNGTISDNITGLMWQKVSGASEQLSCKVYDTEEFTSIDILCRESTPIYADDCNWCAAKAYCDNLELGGYSDWRLPSIKELNSIVDFSRANTSINVSYFTAVAAYYWSSTEVDNDISKAWDVFFSIGSSLSGIKSSNYVARCIR